MENAAVGSLPSPSLTLDSWLPFRHALRACHLPRGGRLYGYFASSDHLRLNQVPLLEHHEVNGVGILKSSLERNGIEPQEISLNERDQSRPLRGRWPRSGRKGTRKSGVGYWMERSSTLNAPQNTTFPQIYTIPINILPN